MKTREPMLAFSTVARSVPGRYDKLEAALAEQPIEVQHEFHQLIQSFGTALIHAKRRSREPWRRQ